MCAGGGRGVGRKRNYDVWRCERLIAARRVTGDYFLIAAIKRERDGHASVPAFDVRVLAEECLLDVLQRETSRLKGYSMGRGMISRILVARINSIARYFHNSIRCNILCEHLEF